MAITGSSGKTTTTTLLGKIMTTAGLPPWPSRGKTWVGGNIGQPLISVVDQIEPTDTVVMELSSFQLEYFHARLNKEVNPALLPSPDPANLSRLLSSWSPPISAIMNITPNHLDRHPNMKHYVRAKRAIIDYQNETGVIILSLDNDMTRTIGNQFRKKVRWFSQEARMPNGAGLVDDTLALFDDKLTPHLLAHKQEVKLRGLHNLNNILAACLMAREAGAPIEAMREVITTFTGVEHRLQLVRIHNQVSYYNDSISTSPDRLVAALHAFNDPIILLVGGRDKRLPWEEAAWLMLVKVHSVIIFGEATEIISEALEAARQEVAATHTTIHRRANLEDAVKLAAQIARAGDVVLLSPGCTSFDAFRNFAERGERFRELVMQL
jgi:UDP-N-acetylmuramoylalanine--D-glutamate ligase